MDGFADFYLMGELFEVDNFKLFAHPSWICYFGQMTDSTMISSPYTQCSGGNISLLIYCQNDGNFIMAGAKLL